MKFEEASRVLEAIATDGNANAGDRALAVVCIELLADRAELRRRVAALEKTVETELQHA